MEVTPLWFQCKNENCDYIPLKTKKQKVKFWKEGESITRDKRQRKFMRNVEGFRLYSRDVEIITFQCKYGSILLYDGNPDSTQWVNSHVSPITDKEECAVCITKHENERLMQL